jgi:segregation and condensation protein B
MMTQDTQPLKHIVEAALLAAGRPMTLDELLALFTDAERPERTEVRAALETLRSEYAERGIELTEVASGFRIQIKQALAPWVSRLWEERPARYSRALLETLALIAYRQPITRGEIEEVRGVTVSTNIMKTLQDRNWIRMVGHRDVPGHPAMYATTREFLDYFSLRSLDELPTLAALKDIDSLNVELDLGDDNPLRQVVDDSDEGIQDDDENDNGTSLQAGGETGEAVVEPPQS